MATEIRINSFLSPSFSVFISIHFYTYKQLYFKQFKLAEVRSLNIKTVLFQTIQFSISTQFSSTWPIDGTLSGGATQVQSRPGSNGLWRGIPHFPKLQHHWCLTIRLFRVISWTLIGGVLLLCRKAIGVFYRPSRLGKESQVTVLVSNTLYIYIYIYIYIIY